MATTRTFGDMLNEYLPESLLREEIIKRDWILTNVEKDDGWKGGQLIVPFQGAHASSVEFGQLAAANDISQYKMVRGKVANYREAWGSLIFNQTDLYQHGQGLNEKTFLRILPDMIENFMAYMKEVVSINLGTGPEFAVATDSTNANVGVFIVDRIDRFTLGQKVVLDDDNSSPANGYVIAINLNTSAVTFSDSRGGSAFDFSAYTVAQNAKFFHPGAQAESFTSVQSALLSAANGGSATLYGETKTAYPYLQAINISGSSITQANILDKLFDAYTEVRTKARGNANTILMSYKHLGSIMKLLETQKGGFKVTPTAQKASVYGWTEIELTSVKGALKLVGIQEWADKTIAFIDPSAFKFYSNGMMKMREAPDGKKYFEQRATSGYSYIVDICLFGELVCLKPSACGIIHSISY
jgi:hypothetical protein